MLLEQSEQRRGWLGLSCRALQAIVTSQAMENLEKRNNMTYILTWSFWYSADNRLGRGAWRGEPGRPVWMLSG